MAAIGAAILFCGLVVVRDVWVAVFVLGAALAAGVASRRQQPDPVATASRLPVTKLSYGMAAAAMALVTVVLPAASFYRVAHTIQTASLVKHGQLRLALAADDRDARTQRVFARQVRKGVAELHAARMNFERLGIYDSFFFQTVPAPAGCCRHLPTGSADGRRSTGGARRAAAFLFRVVIGLRELTHDRAYDRRWQWCERDADGDGAGDGDGSLLMTSAVLPATSATSPCSQSCSD